MAMGMDDLAITCSRLCFCEPGANVFIRQGFQKWVRYACLAHALVTPLIAFVYFYPHFSNNLLLVATPWAITAPLFMLLIAIYFKKGFEIRKQTPKL